MVIAQQGWQGAREDGQSPVFLVTQAVTATRITRLLVLSPSTIPRATVYAGWPSAAMQGEDDRSGTRVCVPHRAAPHRNARLGSARLGVKPGNRYASRHSRGRRGSNVIHERSRVPPVPHARFPLSNDDAHPLTTHANHPHKGTKSQKKKCCCFSSRTFAIFASFA